MIALRLAVMAIICCAWEASPTGQTILTEDQSFFVAPIGGVNGAKGGVKTYSNPLGTPAPPILDTSAFATCP